MRRNKIALTLSFCLIFMTACADIQTENDSAPVMNEADAQGQASENAAISEDTQDVTSHTKEESDKEEAEKEKETTAEKEAVEKEAAGSKKGSLPEAAVAKLSENLYDFQISIDGIVYQFPMPYADFEAMGWAYDGESTDTLAVKQYTALQRWRKDNIYVHTKLANLSEAAVSFSDSMVAGINIERSMITGCDWKILLPGGIEWGVSNADDIREAYGEPASDYDGENYYKMTYQDDYYREIDLYIYKDTNVLEQIDMENLTVSKDSIDN